jgi:bifunctional non-homologous end joining protein LigD
LNHYWENTPNEPFASEWLAVQGHARVCRRYFAGHRVRAPHPNMAALPAWVAPQLTRLVDVAPEGEGWLHEIKYDGYRMHARLDHGAVKLLTRTGLDWTPKYPPIARAVAALGAREAYLDGELCGVGPDGITSLSIVQLASDSGNAAALVFFLFDLLHLDGEDIAARPLIERKARLQELLADVPSPLQFSDHQVGHGPAFHAQGCAMKLEGIVSKRADGAYAPGNRGLWLKVKCLNREEFVVIGWTDPEGSRPFLGALLLGYYDPEGRLIYAGRVGTGIDTAELERLWRRLQPVATPSMPLDRAPPRGTRFGSPLVLSRVHWVRPELVAKVKFLAWTGDNLLRQVVYEGLREDKPAQEVRRDVPHPVPGKGSNGAPRQGSRRR